jgi:molecular chaperone IbpA
MPVWGRPITRDGVAMTARRNLGIAQWRVSMTSFDLSPLFRSTVGFDRLSRALDNAYRSEARAQTYPPYNIETVGENAYRITMAVAGFGEDDIEVTQKENTLVVSGKVDKDEEQGRYLHRGIAARAFERHFQLADYVEVSDASLVNGLLLISLVREVPEAMKPRTIKIAAGSPAQIEQRKAA